MSYPVEFHPDPIFLIGFEQLRVLMAVAMGQVQQSVGDRADVQPLWNCAVRAEGPSLPFRGNAGICLMTAPLVSPHLAGRRLGTTGIFPRSNRSVQAPGRAVEPVSGYTPAPQLQAARNRRHRHLADDPVRQLMLSSLRRVYPSPDRTAKR